MIEDSLRRIARTMQMVDKKPGVFAEEDYYQLVVTHFQNLRRLQEESAAPVSDEALLRLAEKQLAELMRMGRAHKLLRKVAHVQLPDNPDGSNGPGDPDA